MDQIETLICRAQGATAAFGSLVREKMYDDIEHCSAAWEMRVLVFQRLGFRMGDAIMIESGMAPARFGTLGIFECTMT